MGHQINFFALPEDIALIEGVLKETRPLLILPDRSPSARPRVVDTLDIAQDGKPLLFYYLVRPEDLDQVAMHHVPAQGYWTVDVIHSPVIEFTKSFFDTQTLGRGRAYYVDSYYGQDETKVQKSEIFRAWAKQTFSIIRKKFVKKDIYYFAPRALEWSAESDTHRLRE